MDEFNDNDWVNFNARLRPEMAKQLDEEAKIIGVSRMALIQVIVAKHLGMF